MNVYSSQIITVHLLIRLYPQLSNFFPKNEYDDFQNQRNLIEITEN